MRDDQRRRPPYSSLFDSLDANNLTNRSRAPAREGEACKRNPARPHHSLHCLGDSDLLEEFHAANFDTFFVADSARRQKPEPSSLARIGSGERQRLQPMLQEMIARDLCLLRCFHFRPRARTLPLRRSKCPGEANHQTKPAQSYIASIRLKKYAMRQPSRPLR